MVPNLALTVADYATTITGNDNVTGHNGKLVPCIMSDESQTTGKLHHESLSSMVSALTLEDSWPAVPECIMSPNNDSVAAPRRGRRSTILQREKDHDLFKNRFASASHPQQPNLCTPPLRRPSSGNSILTTNSSVGSWSSDFTSAYKSFDDSSILSVDFSVETELLEEDFSTLQHPTNGSRRGSTSNKCTRRLTPTWELPEESDGSVSIRNSELLLTLSGEELLLQQDHLVPPPPLQQDITPNTSNFRKTHKPDFRRESITLEAAFNQESNCRNNWGVKSSLTLESALFDDSAVLEAEPEEEYHSKRSSWAVGSSLTLGTFGDELLPILRTGGYDQQTMYLGDHENPSPTMNSLRFSSHGDSITSYHVGSEQRSVPSTFCSSITPCNKPIRMHSIDKSCSKDSIRSKASLSATPWTRSNHSNASSQSPALPIRRKSSILEYPQANPQPEHSCQSDPRSQPDDVSSSQTVTASPDDISVA